MNTQRPLPVTIAAILMALISLVGLPGPLLPGSEEVPPVVIYGGIVLGIVGLIAAVGLWMLKKWGFWLLEEGGRLFLAAHQFTEEYGHNLWME